MIVVYKFGTRLKGNLSPREGVKVHYLHAEAHGGKVLFTTGKSPSKIYRDQVEQIILTTYDGKFALIANIDDLGKYSTFQPPEDYSIPSLWNTTNLSWFALSNVQLIEGGIKKGDFTCITGKDLLESISGNAHMVYVESHNITRPSLEDIKDMFYPNGE